MRVVYFSESFFADCDFPLIKEMQSRAVNVYYYVPLKKGFVSSSIIEFQKPWTKWGIYKASSINDMHIYGNCLDLNHMYIIGGYNNSRRNPLSWLLWIYALIHIVCKVPNVIHITFQLRGFEKLLLYLPFWGKKVMTVHDPIQHSDTYLYEYNERARRKCFKWADEFILLNSKQKEEFCLNYNIPHEKIHISKLGIYDSILSMKSDVPHIPSPYIIFFGQISPYKGVEYLLEAMIKVHEVCPEINLLVAGGGQLYFDIKRFEKLDYIYWENHYIGIRELIGYVRNSLFSVCPYKDATQSGVVQTSLAMEVPVVATEVGGLPDMVRNGEYGRIVPPCNSSVLADVIIELINCPEKVKRMKDNIREKWKPSMGWATIIDDYLKVYN